MINQMRKKKIERILSEICLNEMTLARLLEENGVKDMRDLGPEDLGLVLSIENLRTVIQRKKDQLGKHLPPEMASDCVFQVGL